MDDPKAAALIAVFAHLQTLDFAKFWKLAKKKKKKKPLFFFPSSVLYIFLKRI